MTIRHVGLVCRSEQNADRFYAEFLGLKKSEKKRIPPAVTQPLFQIAEGLEALNYLGDEIHLEVFIHDSDGEEIGPIAHVCLDVEDRDALLARARAMDLPVLRVPRGDAEIIFIRDYDGNLFEIKKAAGN
jgi:catechol 2,3-dioxygenase-like lactoylglutathione lyase family enzyme